MSDNNYNGFLNLRKTFLDRVRSSFVTKVDSFYPDAMNTEDIDVFDIISGYSNNDSKNNSEAYMFQDRILEYDEMMKALPELDAIFTFYSDEATMENFLNNKVIWAENKIEEVKKESNLLLDFIEIGYQLPIITYNLVAYGNAYAELSLTSKGVSKIIIHDVKTIKRIELSDGRLMGFAQSSGFSKHITIKSFREALVYKNKLLKKNGIISKDLVVSKFGFYPYEHFEMIHWRLRKYSATNLYGYSVMDALRGHWKNNVMARASLIINKIVSSMPRRKISIEVGKNTNKKDIARKMRDIARQFKRKAIFSSDGTIKNTFDPLSEMEDVIVPLIDSVPMFEIDEIPGKDMGGKIEDIEYFDKKIEVVSLIPKSILGGEGDSRSTLAQENMRFAKRIYNIQQEITKGVKKIISVHLYLNDYSVQDLLDNPVIVKMNFASDTAKLIQIETMNGLLSYFSSMEGIYPLKERYFRALGISEKEYEKYKKELEQDLIDIAITEAKVGVEVDKFIKKNKPKENDDNW